MWKCEGVEMWEMKLQIENPIFQLSSPNILYGNNAYKDNSSF
jgi:hypothetical protein